MFTASSTVFVQNIYIEISCTKNKTAMSESIQFPDSLFLMFFISKQLKMNQALFMTETPKSWSFIQLETDIAE